MIKWRNRGGVLMRGMAKSIMLLHEKGGDRRP